MPRNDRVTRQWHLMRHLEAVTRGATLSELVGWVLSFGAGVRVLGPPELHDAVRAAAERILART
jgi:hypothetical protein